MTELGEFALYLALGGTSIAALLGPIGRAVARRIEGRRMGQEQLAELEARLEDLELIHHRLDRLESGQNRAIELESRVDFAERLLSERATHQAEGEAR